MASVKKGTLKSGGEGGNKRNGLEEERRKGGSSLGCFGLGIDRLSLSPNLSIFSNPPNHRSSLAICFPLRSLSLLLCRKVGRK